MNLTLVCPSCQRALRVPDNLLGQAVKCPSCAHVFTVPDSAEEEQPRPPAPSEGVYDEPPQSARRRRPVEEEYEEEEDEDVRPRRRGPDKPGKVTAIAIMMLIAGILATINSVIFLAYMGIIGVASLGSGFLCCLWPGPYYGVTYGILAIVKASRLLGRNAHRERPPHGIGTMMIINILNFDVPSLVMGILVLVFLSDPEVKDYFRS